MAAARHQDQDHDALVRECIRADYFRALRCAREGARAAIYLHTGRELTATELQGFLETGQLPAGVKVLP